MIVGLVADDLTGACDAGVQFARRGWHTLLSLDRIGRPAPSDADKAQIPAVLVITTDVRALTNPIAEERTRSAVLKLSDAGIDRLFLKIDSTLRGSVSGQVSGAVAAWRQRYPDARAVVCPAYPRMGRTVRSNQLFVNGVSVELTPIGRDPVSPVTTGDLSALVPRTDEVSTADALTDDDLAALARSIAGAGPATIAVGSGGLADAVAEAWSSDEDFPDNRRVGRVADLSRHAHILVLVTSLNPVSHAQVARLNRACPDVAVVLAPVERIADAPVAENLAASFADRVRSGRWDVLGLVGGDGARAALRQLGASAIQIVDSVVEGVPLAVVVGGSVDGMPVFTKAGGFGGEDTLVDVVTRLRS